MLPIFLFIVTFVGSVFGQQDAQITTNVTQDQMEVTITNNNEEAVKAFKAALELSETTVDDGFIEPLATRLVKYDGCNDQQKKEIYSGWQQCTCNDPRVKKLYAYTTNKDMNSGLARINFCPKYFGTSTLPAVIKFMKKENVPSFKFDIDRYQDTQAHVWIHELLHINWVSQAKGYGENDQVVDLSVSFSTSEDPPERRIQKAYMGQNTKILARYAYNTGTYVMRNADNLAIYALAHYVQGQIGGYPLYPLVNFEPDDDPHWFIERGNMTVLNMDNPEAQNWPVDGGPDCNDNEDQPTADTVLEFDSFAPDSAYPPEYLQSIASASAAQANATDAPAPDAKDDNKCHGVGGDFWVIHRDTAAKNAGDFCAQDSKSVEYNQDSVDHLRLSIDLPSDYTKGPGDAPDCLDNFVKAVIDGCDGNDKINNPHNYKFGSTLTLASGWIFKLEPLSQQVDEISCDVSYKFVLDGFEIRGKNWPDAKFGANGEGLKDQLEGCGVLTKWRFKWTPDDVKFQWFASGQLPVGTKNCVGNAAKSAGASGKGSCHGTGKI
ncbi:MAG: hypothetical protein Q9202_001697 [Teloschistes flavicans]